MEEAQKAATIDADRAGFIGELVGRFAPAAESAGHSDFRLEWTARLQQLSSLQLAQVGRRAETAATLLDAYAPIAPSFGQAGSELVFFPLPACRLLDTRLGTVAPYNAPLAPNTEISFSVNDSLAVQGGNGAGCGVDNDDPPALAIVITAASPTGGAGNLRTFATGGAVPTAAQLTYSAGTTISTGAITESCTACGPELTVRNQGAGTTHVIVDVVGYFHTPLKSALSCQTVSSRNTILANSYGSFDSPTCPAGTTLSGGGIDTNFSSAEIWVYASRPTGSPIPTTWTCIARSQYAFDWPYFDCYAVCCATPGR